MSEAFAASQLRSLVERIEKLNEEKDALAADLREVYSEAKGQGFETRILRQIVRLRKQETAERLAAEEVLDTYMRGLGMRN